MFKNVISQSDLILDNNSIEKRIYIDCTCSMYGEAVRISLCRTKSFEDSSNEEDVCFEFNTQEITEIDHEYYKMSTLYQKIYMHAKRAYKRFVAAIKILLGQPLYLPTSIVINFEGAQELMKVINNSIEEIRKAEIR